VDEINTLLGSRYTTVILNRFPDTDYSACFIPTLRMPTHYAFWLHKPVLGWALACFQYAVWLCAVALSNLKCIKSTYSVDGVVKERKAIEYHRMVHVITASVLS